MVVNSNESKNSILALFWGYILALPISGPVYMDIIIQLGERNKILFTGDSAVLSYVSEVE